MTRMFFVHPLLLEYLRFSLRGIPHAYQGRAGTGIR
jgi:hypothetical protein